MNVWYLHHYATPHELPGLHRPFEFGRYFIESGNKITVFCSSYLHYADLNLIKNRQKYLIQTFDGIPTVFVKTCGYKGSGFKRIINMFQFGFKLKKYAKRCSKVVGYPDIIIASSPHPMTMLAGLKIAKKFNVPCICEVRDFWPEVFFLGGKLKENGILGKILLKGEKSIYSKADAITFLKEGDHTYISDKGWDIEHGGNINMQKCIYINNGVDLKLFDYRITEKKYNDDDLKTNKFIIVYCGTIRPVNNIDLILDTAKNLNDEYLFLVYGSGSCVERLQNRIIKENITNVKLKGYIKNEYVPSILAQSSLNLLNYSNTVYNWSRGNSSNKLFEYLASGKPVLSTVKMGYDIIERYKCGFSVDDTTPQEIARKIVEINALPKNEYLQLCHNARIAAEQFDIPKLADKYMSEMNKVLEKYYSKEKRK